MYSKIKLEEINGIVERTWKREIYEKKKLDNRRLNQIVQIKRKYKVIIKLKKYQRKCTFLDEEMMMN